MAAPTTPNFGGASGSNVSTAADPWTAIGTHPGYSIGDLFLLLFRAAGAVTIVSVQTNTGSAYTQLAGSTADASDDNQQAWYRRYTGAEGSPASWNIDWSGSQKGAFSFYRISGAADPAINPPQLAEAIGTGANPDPPNITPTGGPKDFLYIVYAGMDGETQTYTSPAGYSAAVENNSGTGGVAATNVRTGAASLGTTASSSQNPGAFTAAAPSTGWTAWTIAIHPPTVADVATRDPWPALQAVKTGSLW